MTAVATAQEKETVQQYALLEEGVEVVFDQKYSGLNGLRVFLNFGSLVL